MPGKVSTELTIHFETHEDMVEWFEFLEYQRKRLKCPPQEVIGRLIAEWKKSGVKIGDDGLEILELPKTVPAALNSKRRKKGDDGDPSDKIPASGPRSE